VLINVVCFSKHRVLLIREVGFEILICVQDMMDVTGGHGFNLVCGIAMYRNNTSNYLNHLKSV